MVWSANTLELAEHSVALADRLGGEALLGAAEPVSVLRGPPATKYVGIEERTVAALNQGTSLAALGISDDLPQALVCEAQSVGQFLALVRRALVRNGSAVRRLLPTEQFRLWPVIISGDDPDGEVAALTRGGYAYADVDRLMTSTGANMVKKPKRHPDALDILGTVLDAKILHLNMVAILAVARQYGDDQVKDLMRSEGMSTSPDLKAKERLQSSEPGLVMAGGSVGTRRRGSKPGGGSEVAFEGLARIARTNDGALNRALASASVDAGLADSFETEKELGTQRCVSDLYLLRAGEPIRLEIMWRSPTSRAEIAKYVLGKLSNYARAVGLLT